VILTFYSFKGGVGRSMALANVAELLIRRGLRVLMVDFDLEAPGLERFFDHADGLTPPVDVAKHRGIIDMLVSYRELRALPDVTSSEASDSESSDEFTYSKEPVRNFVVPIYGERSGQGSLFLLPAGRRAGAEYANYADRVRTFDWDEFYARWDGEQFLDWFRQDAQTLADVVLIDSRTGITELSGVCTFQLADAVVLFSAPNQQNLEGCRLIADSLTDEALITEGRRGRELQLLPVPSRVERGESGLLSWFATEFDRRLGAFVPAHLRFENSAFIDLQVPYVPRYAYLETVAVREPEQPVAADMIAAYTRLTAAIVQLAPQHSRLYQIFHGVPTGDGGGDLLAAEDFVGRAWILDRVNQWLTESTSTMLLIAGEPGSGKTALVRWLARQGRGAHHEAGELGADVVYVHECRPAFRPTLDARAFVQKLADGLAARLPDYGLEILGFRHPNIDIDVRQDISATAPSSRVVGVTVEQIALGDISAQDAFDTLVRQPLDRLERPGIPLLVLVDGLEAALASGSGYSIVDLLTYATSSPLRNLQFLVTSRLDPRVTEALDADRLDLGAEPVASADIRMYAQRRLARLPSGTDEAVVETVVARSEGNFLYASLLLDALEEVSGPATDWDVSGLPTSLADFYEAEIKRQLEGQLDRWEKDRLLFGVLAVAQEGLSQAQLAGILGSNGREMRATMRRWGQFLSEFPAGRFLLFHTSFRDWLLHHPTFYVQPHDAHAAIARYCLDEYKGRWLKHADEYALRYLVTHLVAALEMGPSRAAQGAFARDLGDVFTDQTFLEAKLARLGLHKLAEDLAMAVTALASLSTDADVRPLHDRIVDATGDLSELEEGSAEEVVLLRGASAVTQFYARQYEQQRSMLPPGRKRTLAMGNIVSQVRDLWSLARWLPVDVNNLIRKGSPGERIVGLAIWQVRPELGHPELLSDVIAQSQSAFEQFHALVAADETLPLLDEEQTAVLVGVLKAEVRDPRGLGIRDDSSRMELMNSLLARNA
jgi:hypothetical protein